MHSKTHTNNIVLTFEMKQHLPISQGSQANARACQSSMSAYQLQNPLSSLMLQDHTGPGHNENKKVYSC